VTKLNLPVPARRTFTLVLIKPSHYDDDGYVIQWARPFVPSNSLAVVYSLALDAARRSVLGPDVDLDVSVIDEIGTRVKTATLLSRFRDGLGMVALVGVQSNQFPRALDIARPLRAAGVPVMIGGFHVSGCLAMLPELQADLQAALDIGVSLFAGELEGRIDTILRDATNGTLQPIYNFLNDLPSIESSPVPILPAYDLRRTVQHLASFDAGRGCPYQCSFCTIINVQGRKSRGRTPDDVEKTINEHWQHGVRHFLLTDDNFARNKDWEAIFDRIIAMRERDKPKIRLIIQVDTLCHKIPNFIEKAARAGVNRVFIGLESINPANLLAAKKRQNKITEYRKMLLGWKNVGAVTYAGYIIGFPGDTPESVREDIEIIKRELPLDILEFFCLTPLPGSEDHKVLWKKGAWMDADMNKYDGEHVVADHPKMSRREWEQAYQDAWRQYYTPEHMETILRRGAATGSAMSRLWSYIFFFGTFVPFEKVHPLQGGLFRRKYRLDRRPGLPVEPRWSFWPKYLYETAVKYARLLPIAYRLFAFGRRILKETRRDALDVSRLRYMDPALTPVSDDETETLEMFTRNDGTRNAVEHARKVAHLTGTGARAGLKTEAVV
jgi:hypothetical protein